MDVKICKFFESVGSFFSGGDTIPWCDGDIIAGCEREVAESGSQEQKSESLMRLSWALVHSRQPEDVNRGIAMLEASLDRSSSPLQTREKLYLLAVGYYRNGDYSKSRQLLEHCLEIAPDWRQALTLKKMVEDRIAKGEQNPMDSKAIGFYLKTLKRIIAYVIGTDGVIGIGIAATAVGLLVGGIAALAARKK